MYAALDNGVTGSLAVFSDSTYFLYPSSCYTFMEQDYTKKKKRLTRINAPVLRSILKKHNVSQIAIERPMINSIRFMASISAARCHEAFLIAIGNNIAIYYVDSKEWQRTMLPKGYTGKDLKVISMEVGIRIFPHLKNEISKQKDADALLLLEHMIQTKWNNK